MKTSIKKTLAVTALALGSSVFAVNANALTLVDVPVDWLQRTSAGVATGVVGTTTAGVTAYEVADVLLTHINNQPSYRVDYTIPAPLPIVNQTYDHTEWSFITKNQAGGSATSANEAAGGTVVTALSSTTSSQVGTTAFGSDILTAASTIAVAGGAISSSTFIPFPPPTPSYSLTTTTVLSGTGGYITNNALALFSLATAADNYTSDGNSSSSFINFSQFGVAARHVYRDTLQVPEPASLGLMGLGLVALGLGKKRRSFRA